MSKKYLFDRNLFIKNQSPIHVALFLISLFIDLLLVWNLTFGLPKNVSASTEGIFYWKIGLGFLIIINVLTLKIWNVYTFYKKMTRLQTGFVEILENEIIHCEEKRDITSDRVKFEQGYVRDESQKNYEFILIYRICEVTKYEKTKSGKLTVFGKIEMDCLDEPLGLELGIEDHTITHVNSHLIPAYYEGMDKIQFKLDEMTMKK